MNRFTPACAFAAACAFAVAVNAQDATVKSKTKIDADDARVMTISGCLQPGPAGTFVLSGASALGGDDMQARSKTKIDIDDDETTVKTKEKTEVEHDDKAVGTTGAVAVYEVTPNEGVDLATHVGQKVELTAVALDAAKKGGDDDADVKVKTEAKVKVDDAPDAKVKSTTKAELPRGASPRLTVMSVKQLAPSCPM